MEIEYLNYILYLQYNTIAEEGYILYVLSSSLFLCA